MRRVWRIILNGLTVLSLLLCLASAGLWVRGYWREDSLGRRRAARTGAAGLDFGAVSGGGGVMIFSYDRLSGFPWTGPDGWYRVTFAGRPVLYAGGWLPNRWGFGLVSDLDSRGHWRGITFPAWLPTALFALLPTARVALFIRRRRRHRDGCCRKCGYDLRATPDRCPECSHVPAGATRAEAA